MDADVDSDGNGQKKRAAGTHSGFSGTGLCFATFRSVSSQRASSSSAPSFRAASLNLSSWVFRSLSKVASEPDLPILGWQRVGVFRPRDPHSQPLKRVMMDVQPIKPAITSEKFVAALGKS